MLATSSIASAVLFVGFREKITISVYFIVPAIMITKLYAITILATFNNRPLAVGGPPPLPDLENCYDETPNNKKYSRNLDSIKGEIRIGRTVVKQVWNDVPLSHINVVGQISLLGYLALTITSIDMRRRLPIYQRWRRPIFHAKGVWSNDTNQGDAGRFSKILECIIISLTTCAHLFCM